MMMSFICSFRNKNEDTLDIRNLPATAPTDPLFADPFHLKETQTAMQALNKDKSPGPDGITNIMLQVAVRSSRLLHDFLSSLWLHEIQPRAWELSLMQPIYKGGNKLKTDPASYRGIYLSSVLAKLFEGLLHRLTQYTEAHDTLTPMMMMSFICSCRDKK
jgi:hypothetical protein